MQSRNEKERGLDEIFDRLEIVRDERDEFGKDLKRREEQLRFLSDKLDRSRDREYREIYGKSTFPKSSRFRNEKNARLIAAIAPIRRDVAYLQRMYDAADFELQGLTRMAREIEDELAPLDDAFLGSDFLEPVPVDGSFRQSTIARVRDYIDGLKQSIRDLRTNAAQDEDAEDYQRILPGARFALGVMTKKTAPDNFDGQVFTWGVETVKEAFFNQQEKQLWDKLMSGEAVLY